MATAALSQLVNENSVDEFLEASEILLKFANNILKSPNDDKYRRIRLGNPIVESKLIPRSGALECLFELGFVEDGEYLTLPRSSPLQVIQQFQSNVMKERELIQKRRVPPGGHQTVSGPAQPVAQVPRAVQPANMGPNLQEMQQKEQQFFQKLQGQMAHVLKYENPQLQQKARNTIPVTDLETEANKRLEAVNQSGSQVIGERSSVDLKDCLLLALLNWFKKSFFKWVDAPACEFCNGKTSSQGMAPPTQEETLWGAGRVENYKCDTCQRFTRFPRYNHPGKLLETRRGRCGEWANCFTLCCRAMGFEARYVLDWTDHVWTEVFSQSQQRWLHCDPCENVCDKPLLYEAGWGKKLTYVIAFSKDEILDVTWRYSAKHKELVQRRNECRGSWLVSTIHRLQSAKYASMPEARKALMLARLVAELVEFMTPKTADGKDLSGRTTGSVAWRLARGELGNQSKPGDETKSTETFIFKPTDEEKTKRLVHVRYSCAKDEYVRQSAGGNHTAGFHRRAHTIDNVFRKEEQDWQMVYLARGEGSDTAQISWKFDFTDSGLKIDKVEVCFSTSTFENGKVNVIMCSPSTCAMLKGSVDTETVTELSGETEFTLTATLQGGDSWQHTQLFRQPLQDISSYPFEVKVFLQ